MSAAQLVSHVASLMSASGCHKLIETEHHDVSAMSCLWCFDSASCHPAWKTFPSSVWGCCL